MDIKNISTCRINNTEYPLQKIIVETRISALCTAISVQINMDSRQNLLGKELSLGDKTYFIDTFGFEDGKLTQISGRSEASILVDGAAEPLSFPNKTNILDICRQLCRPFGFDVNSRVQQIQHLFPEKGAYNNYLGSSDTWSVDAGETVFESMERLIKKHGVFLKEDGKKVTIVKYPKSTIKFLGEDSRITHTSEHFDGTELYGKYIVKCLPKGPYTSPYIGESVDPDVSQKKVFRITVDNANEKEVKRRAEWEKNTRKMRSQQTSIKLNGIYDIDVGDKLKIKTKTIEGTYVVKVVRWEKSVGEDSKEETTLKLSNYIG